MTFDDLPSAQTALPNPYNYITWANGHYMYRTYHGTANGYYTATVSGNNIIYYLTRMQIH